MELLEDQTDALGTLEERIRQAIDLVARLRREKDAAVAARDAAVREAASAREQLESLRAERSQVRSRIEKLLGQIDTLGAS
jgi:FtsZ-binding cell division protein ZapB